MARRYYRKNNILGLTKTERYVFKTISDLIRFIIIFVIEFIREFYKLSKYIRKIIINFYGIKKIGYDPSKIIDMLYEITPRQFEIFVAELFKQHGHSVKLTPPTADYGRDVIIDSDIFVECKRYSKNGKQIGREICQKLLGSCQMMNARKGIIVTTGTYHKNAYEAARMVTNLELMDITDIEKMLFDLKPEQIAKIILKTKNCA